MSFDIFTGNEQVTKTLRFELRPTLFTLKHIDDYGIVSLDELRAEKSVELKKLLDDYYRAYIDKRLSVVHNLDWRELFEVMNIVLNHGGKEERKKYENVKRDMRGKVNNELDTNKEMFAGNIITHVLPDFIKNNSDYTDEEKAQYLDTVKLFSGFTTSFGKFFTTRKNVFSDKKIQTSICYRIVDEDMLKEDGKYYVIMRAEHAGYVAEHLTDEELKFGPVLMKKRHPVLMDYVKKEKDTCEKIKKNLADNAGESAKSKLDEFEKKEALLDGVLGKLMEV